MPSFDSLAKRYDALERMSFGSRLQTARRFCLPFARDCRRGLLIGDGDGRFSSELLRQNPGITLDSIDISPVMLAQAERRAGRNADRLHSREQNAQFITYPKDNYDFIGLHFCLDCFPQGQIDRLLPQLEAALNADGLLVHTDFQAKLFWQRFLVRTLYLSFRLTAGLKTQSLPRVIWSAQLQLLAKKELLAGLVFSHVLKKGPANAADPAGR